MTSHKWRPQKTQTVFLVFALSVIWCLAIPFWVSYLEGGLFEEDIAAKLKSVDRPAWKVYETENELEKKARELKDSTSRQTLFPRLSVGAAKEKTDFWFAIDKMQEKREIHVRGFLDDRYVFLWILSYISLGILVFVTYSQEKIHPEKVRTSWKMAALLSAAAFFLIEAPHQFRNHVLAYAYVDGRRAYSYLHPQFGVASFVLEEIRTWGFFFLSIIAILWSEHISLRNSRGVPNTSVDSMSSEASHLLIQYTRWQARFGLLAAAFLPWTYFFWSAVGVEQDKRYLLVGVMVHLFWAIAAWSISRPLVSGFRRWVAYRQRLVQEWLSLPPADRDGNLELLNSVTPLTEIGFVTATGAGALAVLSPLLAALTK